MKPTKTELRQVIKEDMQLLNKLDEEDTRNFKKADKLAKKYGFTPTKNYKKYLKWAGGDEALAMYTKKARNMFDERWITNVIYIYMDPQMPGYEPLVYFTDGDDGSGTDGLHEWADESVWKDYFPKNK